MADLSKLKVVELKEELQKRGASTSGVKADLISRLEEVLAEESISTPNEAVGDKTSPNKPSTVTATTTPVKSPQKRESSHSHSFEYEFGGPLGSLGVMLGLPAVIYMLFFACGGLNDWCMASPSEVSLLLEHLANIPPISEWFTPRATYIFLGWFAFQVVLERLLPGEVVDGVKLATGQKLKYRLNGHLAFWVSLLVVGHGWPMYAQDGNLIGFSRFPLSVLYDEYLGLATASIAFSFVLSVYLYVTSFTGNKLIADGGKSGNLLYDFFIGRELNPRIGSFDLKCFCELRPGLIGWAVLNLGMAAKQFELHGRVSASMVLVNLFQGIYVWDALFQERAILTTMDITTDGFGFMLVFGDLAWVPFTYTLQARYLVSQDPGLSLPWLLGIVALNVFGFSVFRGANSQKDEFRRDPNSKSVSHLKFMQTKRGTKLLVSGWWGMARKINYTGDWCMGLSWCLLTGVGSFIPYFYAIYFGVLLVHRAVRDDGFCRDKYGEDWTEYKKKVPAMFIPGFPF